MSIEVRRVDPPDDEELLEQWTRTDGEDWGHVEALLPPEHPWQIVVALAEFARAEPLETRMSEAIHDALIAVPGVTRVEREDTEVWLAWGTPNGDDLVRAASRAVDPLLPAAQSEHQYAELHRPGPPLPSKLPHSTASAGLTRPTAIQRGKPPLEKGPLIASAVLAVVGVVLLVSGLATGDVSTAVSGGAALVFFGGGLAVMLTLRR